MGLKSHQAVGQFINKMEFIADPDVPLFFHITEVMVLMPILMKVDCSFNVNENHSYIDATGFFDICYNENMEQMQFTSRRPSREIFAYRYVTSYFPQSAFKG
jgi:hypothetical protein